MESKMDYIIEAEQITDYLLSIPVMENEKNNYVDAMMQLNIQFTKYENALWKFMLKSKWRMASVDAALALKEPNNNVRRKLFTMLAILEASPNYTSYFLSKNYSRFYLFKLIGVGIRSIWRAMVGVIIVKNIKRKCS